MALLLQSTESLESLILVIDQLERREGVINMKVRASTASYLVSETDHTFQEIHIVLKGLERRMREGKDKNKTITEMIRQCQAKTFGVRFHKYGVDKMLDGVIERVLQKTLAQL
jgi:hypothetical protein